MKLFNILQTLNIPVAYGQLKERTRPPYILYLGDGVNSLIADEKVFYYDTNYRIEYYFEEKNSAFERLIEDTFNKEGIIWLKSEDIPIPDEEMFMIEYTI